MQEEYDSDQERDASLRSSQIDLESNEKVMIEINMNRTGQLDNSVSDIEL